MPKILVVDDRSESRRYLTKLLGYFGHELLEASDGAQALAVTRAERPDLVIVDLLMPVMDGYEYARTVREEDDIAATPIVFYTATYLVTEAATLAKRCGIKHILQKPAKPDIVLRTVTEALGSPSPSSGPRLERLEQDFARQHAQLLTAKLHEKVETVIPRLAAMIEFGKEMMIAQEPSGALDVACQYAREVMGAKCCLLAIRRNSDDAPYVFHTSGIDERTGHAILLLLDAVGPLGKTLDGIDALRFSDLDAADQISLRKSHAYLCTMLSSPIPLKGDLKGRLFFFDRLGGDRFNSDEEQYAMAIAALIGTKYDNILRDEQTQRYIEELEQRDIHHGAQPIA